MTFLIIFIYKCIYILTSSYPLFLRVFTKAHDAVDDNKYTTLSSQGVISKNTLPLQVWETETPWKRSPFHFLPRCAQPCLQSRQHKHFHPSRRVTATRETRSKTGQGTHRKNPGNPRDKIADTILEIS